jgi:hypothetical protein
LGEEAAADEVAILVDAGVGGVPVEVEGLGVEEEDGCEEEAEEDSADGGLRLDEGGEGCLSGARGLLARRGVLR